MGRFAPHTLFFIHSVGLPAMLVLLGSHAEKAAAAPNIVLLMGDDHGWEETGYNGHPHVKTPC